MSYDKPSQLKLIRFGGVVFLLLIIIIKFYYFPIDTTINNEQRYTAFFPKFLLNFFVWIKQEINFSWGRILPEPQLSLIKSLFFGGKENLPQELKQQIRRVGLSHLVAVSGLHLTIVSQIISAILNILCLSGFLNFFLSCLFILGFVIMADFSSSVIRASIMALLLLLSRLFHRQYYSTSALLLAILIMASINPRIIIDDFGFQLSVLATMGLIYVFPLFKKNRSFNLVQESFFLSMSALIMVLPWIVYKTQMLSWVTPISNILIVPLVPYIMILGFIVALFGWFFPLSFFLGFYLNILLTYVLKIITILAHWPGVEIFIPHLHWFLILIYYFLLIILIYHYQRHDK